MGSDLRYRLLVEQPRLPVPFVARFVPFVVVASDESSVGKRRQRRKKLKQ
jgi:hypothetical protein